MNDSHDHARAHGPDSAGAEIGAPVDLPRLLVALSESFTAVGRGQPIVLESALGVIGMHLGAKQVEIVRADPHGGRWRQASWASDGGAAATDAILPSKVGLDELPRAAGSALVVPLAMGGEQIGDLVVHEPSPGWDVAIGSDGISPVGEVVAHLTQLVESLQWLGAAFQESPLPMVVTDDGRIVHANRAFIVFLGETSVDDVVGGRLADHRVDNKPAGRRAVDSRGEYQFRRRDGSLGWGRVTTTACVTADQRSLAFVQIEDTTEARLVRAQLSDVAAHDPLTGLVDRSSLIDAIAEEVAGGAAGDVRLFLVNVDRIGSINASLGQPEGDRLLEIVAGRLHFATRVDDVVSRLGGDQFAILLRGATSDAEVRMTAQRLLILLREPIELGGQSLAGSVSIGVGTSRSGTTVESLLRDADIALRHAKAGGRNRYVVFDEAFRAAIASRSRMEGELRVALAAERLELHYQPEVDLVSAQVLGVEALARWPHPAMGLLSADAFVTVAEDMGLVAELGRWALATACHRLADWSARHPSLAMRVNVSAAQLAHDGLVEDVRSALDGAGLDPARLCLEITETAVMTDVDQSMRVLAGLHGLGVELAIDDFGTGFSSLAYLRRFPVEILKVDQSFVADVFEPDGRAIVEAVLQLARSLDLEVIAEGIETDGQLDALTELGCRRGQGHLFSAALAEVDLLAWIDERA